MPLRSQPLHHPRGTPWGPPREQPGDSLAWPVRGLSEAVHAANDAIVRVPHSAAATRSTVIVTEVARCFSRGTHSLLTERRLDPGAGESAVLGQRRSELPARGDAEFGEHVARVPLDG